MSSANTKKIYIQIDSETEQRENIKKGRKTLKDLQVTTDKENLTGRPQLDKLSRLKAAVHEINLATNITENAKRKKFETKVAETQTSPDSKSNAKIITVEDLCSDENPGEHYWERLAEKRREALEQSLEENQRLYERIDGLEKELDTSREQIEEAKHLVSVLTEMLNENESEVGVGEDDETDIEGVTPLAEGDSDSNTEESDPQVDSATPEIEKKD